MVRLAETTRQFRQNFVIVCRLRDNSYEFIRREPKVLQHHFTHPASDLVIADRAAREFGARNIDHPRQHDETSQLLSRRSRRGPCEIEWSHCAFEGSLESNVSLFLTDGSVIGTMTKAL